MNLNNTWLAKCFALLLLLGSLELLADESQAIDYQVLASRMGGSEKDESLYAQMGEYKKIIRTQILQNINKVALEITNLSPKEFKNYQNSADYSYQKEGDYNPLQAMSYSYESFYMTHHHNDTPEELIGDALDFYYGRNQTKQNKAAAKFLLKQLRTHKSTEMNRALDALLASGKLDFSF